MGIRSTRGWAFGEQDFYLELMLHDGTYGRNSLRDKLFALGSARQLPSGAEVCDFFVIASKLLCRYITLSAVDMSFYVPLVLVNTLLVGGADSM
jgi:hypothetical protein